MNHGFDHGLTSELQCFENQLQDLRELYDGQHLLVKGNAVVGAFATPEEAYCAGVEKYGATPFLIRQVSSAEKDAAHSKTYSRC